MTWIERDSALHREWRTKDFLRAFEMARAVVEPAERLNHHPDVEFGWGYLRIRLTTHDAGGVTARDHELAKLIEEAMVRYCE